MSGALQASTPQDQGEDLKTVPARSLEKLVPKPQREGCSNSGDLRGPGGGRGREPSPACSGHTTLQQSSKFKILFYQLGLTTKERKIVTEALVSITSGAGIECLSAEIPKDRVLLQESTEITFSDEDMKVGYPDHRRPLYLAASINQIPIKRALVDTGASVNLIPLSTLKAAGILERKIQGCPIEVIGFGGRGEYTAGHIQL